MSPLLPLRRAAAALILTGLALGLAACRSSEDFRPPSSAELSDAVPLPVTLARNLRGLKERSRLAGEKRTYKIGYLLEPLFPATDGRAFLSLVESDLEQDWKGRGWSSRYRLSMAFQHAGATRVITVTSDADSDDAAESGRAAIEECVADAYRQISALLQTSARAGTR